MKSLDWVLSCVAVIKSITKYTFKCTFSQGVGTRTGVTEGEGVIVGTGIGVLDKTSRSLISVIFKILVDFE